MGSPEIKLQKAARFYENYPTTERPARQFDVNHEQLDEKHDAYVVKPASVRQAHLEERAVRRNLAPNVYEFTFEKPLSTGPAAMLAHTAFREIAIENRTAQIVALMPYDLDNPETNLNSSGVYVDTLGMEGQGLTRDGEVIFVGTAEDIVNTASASLAYGQTPIYRASYVPPGEVA